MSQLGIELGGRLAAAETARRCRCDCPCLLAAEDDVRCLKCGRPPALRLGLPARGRAAAAPPALPSSVEGPDGH